jgi:hypothetical protein
MPKSSTGRSGAFEVVVLDLLRAERPLRRTSVVLTAFDRRPLGLGQPGPTATPPYLESSGAPRDPPGDALADR